MEFATASKKGDLPLASNALPHLHSSNASRKNVCVRILDCRELTRTCALHSRPPPRCVFLRNPLAIRFVTLFCKDFPNTSSNRTHRHTLTTNQGSFSFSMSNKTSCY